MWSYWSINFFPKLENTNPPNPYGLIHSNDDMQHKSVLCQSLDYFTSITLISNNKIQSSPNNIGIMTLSHKLRKVPPLIEDHHYFIFGMMFALMVFYFHGPRHIYAVVYPAVVQFRVHLLRREYAVERKFVVTFSMLLFSFSCKRKIGKKTKSTIV